MSIFSLLSWNTKQILSSLLDFKFATNIHNQKKIVSFFYLGHGPKGMARGSHRTWIIPSFSNWIHISCVREFPSFVPLSGQWFMMIVGKQWRHKKTSRPLEKLHDWALKDKTNVARRSSEHSDERVGVSSSTLIVDMILYCRCGSQLRHAWINFGVSSFYQCSAVIWIV